MAEAGDHFADADVRYEAALARRDAIELEWIRLGEPLLSPGSREQEREHPLIKMLREHDVLLSKLSADKRRRHSGPAPSAVVKPLRVVSRKSA